MTLKNKTDTFTFYMAWQARFVRTTIGNYILYFKQDIMASANKEQQDAIDQIYNYAGDLLVNKKKSAMETQNALIEQGIDAESASVVVANLEQQINDAKQKRAKKDILHGALWCFGGILVTVVTFSAASGGGTYVVTWGAIIFGAIQLIKGLVNSRK